MSRHDSYEVLGYQTSSDFEGRNFTLIAEYCYKDEAFLIGYQHLYEYYQIKIQSEDREFIELLSPTKS